MVEQRPEELFRKARSSAPAGDERQAMLDQAERCRRLARSFYDRQITSALHNMAEGFERSADQLASKRRP